MVLQGFNPSLHTPAEFVEFCERLKFAEDEPEPMELEAQDSMKGGANGMTLCAKSEKITKNMNKK